MPGIACAFTHCRNSTTTRPSKRTFTLPTILLHQGEDDRKISSDRRAAWLAIINRKDIKDGSRSMNNIRVCEDHFLGKKPSYYRDVTNVDWKPSVNLGGDCVRESQKASTRNSRYLRRMNRHRSPEVSSAPIGHKLIRSTPSSSPTDQKPIPADAYKAVDMEVDIKLEENLDEEIMKNEEECVPFDFEPSAETDPLSCQNDVGCQTELSGEDIDLLNHERSKMTEKQPEIKQEGCSDDLALGNQVVQKSAGVSFTDHIDKRIAKFIKALNEHSDLSKMSLECAKRLFELKFSPIASYGVEIIWEYLSVEDFAKLENVKPRYFKKVMGCSKYNKNTYVYMLAEEELFVSDLRKKHNLPETENYLKFSTTYTAELKQHYNYGFIETPAMNDDGWKQPLCEERHVLCSFAMHGFHNQICKFSDDRNQCFEANRYSCVCKLCGSLCGQWHLLNCPQRTRPLKDYAKMSD
ncbi:uncharacterized protein LOC135939573 [Cloeon dipterum]|uniref:uncharacterized protein LOC135939573 n=1 Tax=Cloeon dipterum TaxID=197152 RepID=UPI0032201C33